MQRSAVLQGFLNLFETPSYLEIGVSQAVTFHAVRASTKVAVDPRFKFPLEKRETNSTYHEVTSDEFFRQIVGQSTRFNVIFLDGLHIFDQTLRDLISAVDFIDRGGVIVIDDVLPMTYHSTLPAKEIAAVRDVIGATDKAWVGDVYRLVFFIQAFFQNFDYATVAESHGLLAMWRGKRERTLFQERSVENVSRLDFRDSILQRSAYNIMPFSKISDRVRGSL